MKEATDRIKINNLLEEAGRMFVTEIEAEQALVASTRELITRFEIKIQAVLAKVWGE